MNNIKTTLFIAGIAICLLNSAYAQQTVWEETYYNNSVGNHMMMSRHYIEFSSDGTLFLAEADRNNNQIRVKKYDQHNADWVQVGQDLPGNMGAQCNFDFLITPEDHMYVGIHDTIFHYNTDSRQWEATPAAGYAGGLSCDHAGNVYFIYNEAAGNAGGDKLFIALINKESITVLDMFPIEVPCMPAKFRSNQMIIKNGTFYVSIPWQYSDYISYFKGNLTTGFVRLNANDSLSHMQARLGMASMAVNDNGDIIIATAKGSTPSWVEMYQYDEVSDSWKVFDTTGIRSGSCHYSQLRYDKNGVLHFIYSGSNGTGFIFKYNDQQWEHIGPKRFPGLHGNTAPTPHMAFDNDNRIHFVSGHGALMIPLRIHRYGDSVASNVHEVAGNIQYAVYPNPAVHQVTIDFTGTGLPSAATTLTLFDMQGKKVFGAIITDIITHMPVTGLPKGIYFLKTENREGATVNKLIIGRELL